VLIRENPWPLLIMLISILLTGGDKKGKDEKLFYKDLIKEALEIIELYKDHKW